jgi:hypothetical protein
MSTNQTEQTSGYFGSHPRRSTHPTRRVGAGPPTPRQSAMRERAGKVSGTSNGHTGPYTA